MTSLSGAVVLLAGVVLVAAGAVAEAVLIGGKEAGNRGTSGLALLGGGLLAVAGFLTLVASFFERRNPG